MMNSASSWKLTVALPQGNASSRMTRVPLRRHCRSPSVSATCLPFLAVHTHSQGTTYTSSLQLLGKHHPRHRLGFPVHCCRNTSIRPLVTQLTGSRRYGHDYRILLLGGERLEISFRQSAEGFCRTVSMGSSSFQK